MKEKSSNIDDGSVKIELASSKGIAFVDESDAEKVLAIGNWYRQQSKKNKGFYAAGKIIKNGKKFTILMHHLILEPEKGNEIHHIDGNGLNNKRSNLMCVTRAEHAILHASDLRADNKTGASGVSFVKERRKFSSRITMGGKKISLGYSDTVEEAIELRKIGELAYIGNNTDALKELEKRRDAAKERPYAGNKASIRGISFDKKSNQYTVEVSSCKRRLFTRAESMDDAIMLRELAGRDCNDAALRIFQERNEFSKWLKYKGRKYKKFLPTVRA